MNSYGIGIILHCGICGEPLTSEKSDDVKVPLYLGTGDLSPLHIKVKPCERCYQGPVEIIKRLKEFTEQNKNLIDE